MACPDRLKDQRIVKEIERRKALLSTPEPETQHQQLIISGDILDIIYYIDIEKVIKLEKSGELEWIITMTLQ